MRGMACAVWLMQTELVFQIATAEVVENEWSDREDSRQLTHAQVLAQVDVKKHWLTQACQQNILRV